MDYEKERRGEDIGVLICGIVLGFMLGFVVFMW